MSQPPPPVPIAGLKFSRDRPLGLDATLASWSRRCRDSEHVGLTVLSTSSTPGMEPARRADNRVQHEYVNRAGSAPGHSCDALAPQASGTGAATRARPIRTAYIAYLPGIDRGGQVNLVRLIEGLDRTRHESLVVTPAPGPLSDTMRSLRVRCTVSPVMGTRPPGIPQRIANVLRAVTLRRSMHRFRPDLLYVDASRHVRLVRRFGLSGGAPVLWHAQTATYTPKDVAAIRQADHVVAVAPHVQDLVRSLVPGKAVDCIPNAVDADRFRPGTDHSLRLELGVGDDELVVLFVGGLLASKGLADLLVAFATVRSAVPHARLWIVGSGAEEAALRRLADREGLARHAAFLGMRNDVERLYRAADLFCLPSHSEGLPLCVLEAMSSGLACVGSDVPGITHLLDGDCGIVVPLEDTAALADGIVAALRSAPLRESLGRVARQRVLERHRIEAFVAGFDALLERIAGRAA